MKSQEILPKTTKELQTLFDFVAPKALSRTIVELHFTNIIENHDPLPVNFVQDSENVYFLLKFLEVADDELNSPGEDSINDNSAQD